MVVAGIQPRFGRVLDDEHWRPGARAGGRAATRLGMASDTGQRADSVVAV